MEFGTHSTRAGFIGDDRPRVVIPSAYVKEGRLAGDLALVARTTAAAPTEIVSVLDRGEVRDWEGLEALWDEAVVRRLGLKTSDDRPPLLLVESPGVMSQESRERLCRVAFERLRVPALFMGKAPVLAVFESGRHSGLVVDIGAGSVSVTPVYDGYVIKGASVVQRGFGGDWLNAQLLHMLQTDLAIPSTELCSSLEVRRRQAVPLGEPSVHESAPGPLSESFVRFHRARLLDDVKEAVVQVSETPFNPADLALRPPRYYEFPTGYNRNFVLERFRIGELLFSPQKYRYAETQDAGESFVGLLEMASRAVALCDVDMRAAMVGNIVVCGGGSLLSGLAERVNHEFGKLANYGRVRVHTGATSNERRFGAWIGGSILGSLSTFQHLWMTKKEYDEHGAAAIERKFP